MKIRFFLLVSLVLGSLAQGREPVTPEVAARTPSPLPMGSVVWSPDGDRFVYKKDQKIHQFQLGDGEDTLLVNLGAMKVAAVEPVQPERFVWKNRRVRESTIQWFPDGARLLLKVQGDLFVYRIEERSWDQLTETSDDETDPKLSPDGRLVTFLRGPDLYSLEIASGKVRRLTRDGSDTIGNGRLDWVYPEELDLGTAHWWSPDSRHVSYLQFDTSRIILYPHADLTEVQAVAEPQRFPKAGTPNPDVRLGVVRANGGRTRWLEEADGDDEILARVAWLPDSSGLLIQKMDRIQTRLALIQVPLRGEARVILEETDDAWINIADDLRVFSDSSRFLWSSERSGFRHLYLYTLDGNLQRQLTRGEWEVTGVDGLDEQAGAVYFTSTESSPLERRLYTVNLNGDKKRQITTEPGVHSISMAPDTEHFIDSWSSMTEPPRRVLRDSDGDKVRLLAGPDRKTAERYELMPQEVLEIKAPDDALLYARIVRPPGFDPRKKYPAVVIVYGGPHSQTIVNSWGGADLKQALAHAGFVVWQLDNRGSAGRGHEWETKLYRRFGKYELQDQVTGVRHLIEMGFVDPDRVGIHGWSYGGFMTLYALCQAPDDFAAGVAGAPVTDWRNYDTIYTERYLGLPSENEAAYRKSSPVHLAGKLDGDLLLVHNIEDDNVLFQHTLQMAAALQNAGKLFNMMVYPQKAHGVSGPEKKHLYRTMVEFFVDTLGE